MISMEIIKELLPLIGVVLGASITVITSKMNNTSQQKLIYLDKQHTAYSKLNELLMKSEGVIFYQILKSYPDFKNFSERELKEYLLEKDVLEQDLQRILALKDKPQTLQEEMQKFINLWQLNKARGIYSEMTNHFWINAVYFSDKVANKFEEIQKLFNELLLIQEYPTDLQGGFSKKDHDKMTDLQNQLRPLVNHIIKQMKQELTVGQVK